MATSPNNNSTTVFGMNTCNNNSGGGGSPPNLTNPQGQSCSDSCITRQSNESLRASSSALISPVATNSASSVNGASHCSQDNSMHSNAAPPFGLQRDAQDNVQMDAHEVTRLMGIMKTLDQHLPPPPTGRYSIFLKNAGSYYYLGVFFDHWTADSFTAGIYRALAEEGQVLADEPKCLFFLHSNRLVKLTDTLVEMMFKKRDKDSYIYEIIKASPDNENQVTIIIYEEKE